MRRSESMSESESNKSPCQPLSQRKGISLKNTQDSSRRLNDRLHLKAAEVDKEKCSSNVCSGSIVTRDGIGCPKNRCREAVWKDAKEFLTEFFSEGQSLDKEQKIAARLNEVFNRISQCGTYEQTLQELVYGAQHAWRNAPRCIGRMQWSTLEVFDGRDVTSTADAFKMICQHLKYATNEGLIRSSVTVFGPLENGKTNIKLWNSQYISYAGYTQEDGTVVGDRINTDLTSICQKLGWKGKGTRFDILPIVLQKNDDLPEFYDIPEDVVLIVKLKHPRFPKFEDLGLEWYAVPAVCNMYLDCAGVVYPTCGFNGWYMSTEVMRDLIDPSRYNLLEIIARSFAMDTNLEPVYWKDIAAAELNLAILHSFQAKGVTIVDQYTASETFMRHMTNESKLRGGCPADWVWINPPISGSLTSVYHQEMLNYQLKPTFGYQIPPHRSYSWRKGQRQMITLYGLVRSIQLINSVMRGIMEKRVRCTILFASETGVSERYATLLQNLYMKAFNCNVSCIEDYDFSQIAQEDFLLFVVSTYGNGEAPRNGRKFNKSVIPSCSKSHSIMGKDGYNNTAPRFAVFGLGSRAYPNFCAFASLVDNTLHSQGFQRLLPLATEDAQTNLETSFRYWCDAVFQQSIKTFKVNFKAATEGSLIKDAMNAKDLQPTCTEAMKEMDYRLGLEMLHKRKISTMTVESIKFLSKPSASKEYFQMTVRSDSILSYDPGDHLVIFPSNQPDDVEYISNRVDLPLTMTKNSPIKLNDITYRSSSLREMPVCSLQSALTFYVNISEPPTHDFLQQLVKLDCIKDCKERTVVEAMVNDYDEYLEYANTKPSLRSLLKDFKSIRIPASVILTKLSLLHPRQYSISSFNGRNNSRDTLDITVGVVNWWKASKDEECQEIYRLGLCSNWLKNLPPQSSIHAYISKSTNFCLPQDRTTPIVLVATGSGIAPFRSFWKHNQGHKGIQRKILLFYGCRDESENLYYDELKEYTSLYDNFQVYTAHSRSSTVPKKYVQHCIMEQREKILQLLFHEEGHVYLCGNAEMVGEVKRLLGSLLCESPAAGNDLSQMKASGRIHEEIHL